MRGKVLGASKGCDGVGITPAYAGKRRTIPRRRSAAPDHPRVCGEKTGCPGSLGSRIGSPPHVRRKGLPGPVMRITGGITPACAGKSFLRSSSQSRSGDHPRVCGEKMLPTAFVLSFTGSPPRMRGKVKLVPERGVTLGITPACAGKSRRCLSSAAKYRDHPRMCGEKSFRSTALTVMPGSPPHVRGKD